MKKLKLLEFVETHENWRELLVNEPYFIKIVTEGDYTIFKYNQLNSDFNNKIVRECRGLILDNELKPVCVPFFKFGNYGESYCPEIDWNTAQVQEKIDGSLCKIWHHNGKWRVSTNGMIDAYTAELVNDARLAISPFKTFGELFDVAARNSGLNYDILDKNYTYMFELVSPFNRVIVSYEETRIFHIGARNNTTLEEEDVDIGVAKPKRFHIKTLGDCIEAAKALPFDEEGYVVVDKNYNRVKIKSPQYVMAAHVRNNGCVTTDRILDIIRANEVTEFLIYCNDFEPVLRDIERRINAVIERMDRREREISALNIASQKDFAFYIKDDVDKDFLFTHRKNLNFSAEDYVKNLVRNKEFDDFLLRCNEGRERIVMSNDKQKTIDNAVRYLDGVIARVMEFYAPCDWENAVLLIENKNEAVCDFLREWYERVTFSAKKYLWSLSNSKIEELIENV